MTAAALTVTEAGPDRLDLVRELYRAVRGTNRPEGYDRWRYFGSPDGACPGVIALDGARIAGFYTLWPVRLRIGGEVVLGGQSMDTMTHPDYQGRGVFTLLANACYELAAGRGYRLMYGFPNALSYPGFVRRLGWDHTGDIRHWVRFIRPSRHPRVPRVAGPLADLGAALLPRGGGSGVDVTMAKPAEDEIAALVRDTFPDPGVCRIERTQRWLDWRYAEAAAHGYEWLCARRDGRAVAACAWGMQTPEWGDAADGRAHLVELLGTDRSGLGAVLAAVIARASARSAWVLETVTNVAPSVPVLRRAGFFSHRAAPLIVRALGSESFAVDIHDHAAWRFVGGDLDTM